MTSPFPPGSLLAACIRDSGHESQELSALHQERSLREWCQKNGYTLTRIFTDSRSGKSAARREDFQAMMAYFRQPDVPEAGVVVWSFSRFARNALEAQYYRSELKQRGKILYSITEPLPVGPEAIIIEAVYDFAHAKYLDDLSSNTAAGLRDLVQIHGCVPGTPPKGFRRSDPVVTGHHRNGDERTACRWVPDPDYIPLIRKAFEMRAAHASLGAIHKATGLFGSINCYAGFLRNPIYIGTLEYADLVIENYCNPVVDRETWDAVQRYQARFKGRHHVRTRSPDHPRRLTSNYLLSGLVHCLRCGAPLAGHTSTIRDRKYHSYRCTDAKNRRACDARFIPAAPLESEVLRLLQEHILRPDHQVTIYEIYSADALRRSQTVQAEIHQRRSKLAKLDAQLERLAAAIAAAGHSPALLAKLKNLETEKSLFEAELAALDQKIVPASDPLLTPEQIRDLCTHIRQCLQQGDIEERRRILAGQIKQIAVERDPASIHGVIQLYEYPAILPQPPIVPISNTPGGN